MASSTGLDGCPGAFGGGEEGGYFAEVEAPGTGDEGDEGSLAVECWGD